jgi:hypothetical protein
MLYTGKRKRGKGCQRESQQARLVTAILAEGDQDELQRVARSGLANESLRCKVSVSDTADVRCGLC